MSATAAVRGRLSAVRERIARAAERVDRDPSHIRLVAVSKTFPIEYIRAAFDAGQVDFGENKVQEAVSKIEELASLPLKWHLVGHLQTNKARKAAAHFDVIQSVDSVPLLTKLDEAAQAAGRHTDVLFQVDFAGEATKHGVNPADLSSLLEAGRGCQAVNVRGLMLLPPYRDDPGASRQDFAALRRLRDELVERGCPSSFMAELSMGMSHDFDVAIEEGATIVRVGTAIFGERSYV